MSDVMQKAPADVLDFDVDFSRWLKGADRLVEAVATISGDTDVEVQRTDFADRSARVWLAGGAVGQTGTVSLVVVTVEDRTKEFCFVIKVRECR
jgi:hypothetical protein